VAYEHRRPLLQRKDAALAATSSASEVSGFCTAGRLQADTLKTSDDFGPTGTVRICTMDQTTLRALTVDAADPC